MVESKLDLVQFTIKRCDEGKKEYFEVFLEKHWKILLANLG